MHWTDSVARRVKLRDLQIVLAVAKSGAIGRAAIELAVSQPAISKAISDLEYELGVRLFDRSSKGVTPTVYGAAVLGTAAAIFDDLRQGMKTIEFLADPTTGHLRIGTSPPLAAGFVPAVIGQLSASHPRFAFDIVQTDVPALHRELHERTIDLIIAPISWAPQQDNIDVETLFYDQHVPMVGANSRWARRRKITWAELINEPWVLPPTDIPLWSELVGAFHASGMEPPRPTVATMSIPSHLQLLETNRFVTLLPMSMLRFGAHKSLRRLRLATPVKPRPVVIVTLKSRTLGPVAEIFIQQARDVVARSREPSPQ